jgi:hypothetical protein
MFRASGFKSQVIDRFGGRADRCSVHPVLQRDSFAGWAKAVALPTEECGFTSAVGKIRPLPTLRWNGIRVLFSLQYEPLRHGDLQGMHMRE